MLMMILTNSHLIINVAIIKVPIITRLVLPYMEEKEEGQWSWAIVNTHQR